MLNMVLIIFPNFGSHELAQFVDTVDTCIYPRIMYDKGNVGKGNRFLKKGFNEYKVANYYVK